MVECDILVIRSKPSNAEKRVSQGGSLLPFSLPKLPYVPILPRTFFICSAFNNFAYHVFVVLFVKFCSVVPSNRLWKNLKESLVLSRHKVFL